MRHEAIYETHPNVFRIDDSFGAFDRDDNLVSLDESLIQTKIAELQAAEPMRLLKEERNQRIAESDWRFLSDQTPSQALNLKAHSWSSLIFHLPATNLNNQWL